MNDNYNEEESQEQQQNTKISLPPALKKKLITLGLAAAKYVLIIFGGLTIILSVVNTLSTVVGWFTFDLGNENVFTNMAWNDTTALRKEGLSSFATVVEDREKEWSEKGAQINKAAVTLFLFPDDTYDPTNDYSYKGACFLDDTCKEHKILSELALKIVDAQVEETTYYFCQAKIEETEENQEESKDDKEKIKYGEKKECGIDEKNCEAICGKEKKITEEIRYSVRDLETYANYMLDEGIFEEVFKTYKYELPNNKEEKDKVLLEKMKKTMQLYVYVFGNSSQGSTSITSGEFLSCKGISSLSLKPMLDSLGMPVLPSGLSLTGCFGQYGDSCSGTHDAIDVANRGRIPILSMADGVVEAVKSGATQSCLQGWSNGSPICTTQCRGSANMIQIKHTLNIDGKEVILHSKYVHLQDVNVSVGQTIKLGQEIGTMGNTGCSSGQHLHFSILDDSHACINPEELYYRKGYFSDKVNVCNSYRNACGAGFLNVR